MVMIIALTASPGATLHCDGSHLTLEFTMPIKSMESSTQEVTASGSCVILYGFLESENLGCTRPELR